MPGSNCGAASARISARTQRTNSSSIGIQTSGPVMVRLRSPAEAEFHPLTDTLNPAAEKLHQGRKVEMMASNPAAAKTRSGIAILR